MKHNTRRRMDLAALISPIAASVLFGIGAVAALTIPVLRAHLAISLATVIILSLPLGALAGWVLAPRMRARHPRDSISG